MKVIMVPPPFVINEGKITSTNSHAELYDPRSHPHQQNVSMAQPNPDYVLIDGQVYNVHKTASQTYMAPPPSYGNKNFEYDPLKDYWQWYTGETWVNYAHQIQISRYEIPQKCWAHSEINAWMEAHLIEPVLIQNTASMWSLNFVLGNDKIEFENWWRFKQKNYSMWLSVDKEDRESLPILEQEVKNWCNANLRGSWSIDRSHDRLKVSVKNDEEAVMFKLAFNPKDTW